MQQFKHRSRLISFQLRYGLVSLMTLSVVLVAFLLLGLATYVNWQNTLTLQDVRSQVVAAQVDAYMGDLERKLSYLSRIEGLLEKSTDAQTALIESLTRQNAAYESITLLNEESQTTAEIVPYGVDLSATERDYAFYRAYSRKENFVGAAQLSKSAEGVPLLTLAVPLYDTTSKVSGAAIARINLKFLWSLIGRTQIGRTGYAYLLDNRDIVTAQPMYGDGYVLASLADRAFVAPLRSRAGYSLNQSESRVSKLYPGLYHNWVIGSATPIGTVPWLAVVEIPFTEALIPFKSLLVVTLLGVLLIFPFILWISSQWTRQIIKPLKRLQTVATRLSQGDLAVRVPMEATRRETRNELHILGQLFNHMAEQLQHKVAALTEEKQLSEQTLIQLRQAQSQLIQSEKMSSLGRMVAGIAHEINNPVSFIYGNTDCLSEYVEDIMGLLDLYQEYYPNPSTPIQAKSEAIEITFIREDIFKILSSMTVGTQRIQEIVQSLRVFSRLDESEVKAVNIHDGIDSTLLILNSRLEGDESQTEIEVEKQYGDLPEITCFAGQLNQVFMNILSNAIDALRECDRKHPQIQIVTAVEQMQIRIDIKDNGPGIPEQIQSKIFDPFFTTKAVGKGTGMGMSISYKVITENHRGSLSVESAPDRGACFTICLPLYCLTGRRLSSDSQAVQHSPYIASAT